MNARSPRVRSQAVTSSVQLLFITIVLSFMKAKCPHAEAQRCDEGDDENCMHRKLKRRNGLAAI